MTEHARAFIAALLARQVLAFGDFVLKSGRRSPYFFNLGAIADGAGLDLLGGAYAAEVLCLPVQPDVLFGPAYKGIAIATATAMELARQQHREVGIAYNRKEAKAHGEGGALVGAPLQGRRIVIVDDVVTDGAAKREAADAIAAASGEVVGVVLALDRREPVDANAADGETAVQALRRTLGVPVRSIVDVDDVLAYLESTPAHAAEAAHLRAGRG